MKSLPILTVLGRVASYGTREKSSILLNSQGHLVPGSGRELRRVIQKCSEVQTGNTMVLRGCRLSWWWQHPCGGRSSEGEWCSHLEHPFHHQMLDKDVKIVCCRLNVSFQMRHECVLTCHLLQAVGYEILVSW